MTLDDRLRQSLATYANGVVMTASDTDRMQQDLNGRLGSGRGGGRGRALIAVAAVVVLAVIAAAAVLWLRPPPTDVPANPTPSQNPQGFGPLPAITFDEDAMGSNLTAWHADNTALYLPVARNLVHPIPSSARLTWQVQGSSLVVDYVNAQAESCRATKPWRVESPGLVRFDSGPQVGPICDASTTPPSTSTWLSPGSAAGLRLTANTGTPLPVTDAVQLNGVWLLQGTGLLLASDETAGSGGADYLLDDDGDIDVAPDASGRLIVSADGGITLTSTRCGDTALENAKATGDQTRDGLTVTVKSDPCDRFGGVTVLTWVKVL